MNSSVNQLTDLAPTRHSLVRRMKNLDDQESWQDFFNTYWKLIYSVARRAGLNDAEAQDAVQETVLTVTRNIGNFKVGAEHGSFRGWLLHITRWRINDQFRKRPPASTQEQDPSAAEHVVDSGSFDLEAAWDTEWKSALMAAAVEKVKDEVDPEYFQLWDLHVLQGMPALEVARKLDVKLSRVYFAKYKVSRLVRKAMLSLEDEPLTRANPR
jgi:RNA polymerase sigma factor (sigma-70 family)